MLLAARARVRARASMNSVRGCALFSTTPARRSDSPAQRVNQRGTGPAPPYGHVGVAAALETDASTPVRPTIFAKEFSLADRVALVSGANRGIGLELAAALAEAGARAVYCVDLPQAPGEEWTAARAHLARMEGKAGEGRLEYFSADVRDQEAMWKIGETIGDREGRFDACVAAAGVLPTNIDCLEYSAKAFDDIVSVNVNGMFFTAQAAGRQMARFGSGGSIILIASMSGSIANKGLAWVSYNTSKSAVLQMGRSMACEMGPQRIRVNTISPGYIYTRMTAGYLKGQERLIEEWCEQNPLGRIGRPDELRGAVTWLASDASAYCTGSDIRVDGGHAAW